MEGLPSIERERYRFAVRARSRRPKTVYSPSNSMQPLASMVLKSTRRIFLSCWRTGLRAVWERVCSDGARRCAGGSEVAVHEGRRDGEVADVIEAVAESSVGSFVRRGIRRRGVADGVRLLAAIGRRAVTRPDQVTVAVGLCAPYQVLNGGIHLRGARHTQGSISPARILRRMTSQPSRLW